MGVHTLVDIMKGICFLLLLPLFGLGQEPHVILNSLTAYKQTNGILVRWVIKGGSQCNGTKVYRANQQGEFEQVNHIPGICGSNTENETYQFFDSVPFPNQINTYKLELGFQGFSGTVSVFYEDFGNQDHMVFSDFQTNSQRILFTNDLNRKATLQVFDSTGSLLHTQSNTGNEFLIRPDGLRAGIYLYRISGASEKPMQGKFYLGGR